MTMKSIARLTAVALFFALFLTLGSSNAFAQGKHPAYFHALSDLTIHFVDSHF
jgi:hypothetical protein